MANSLPASRAAVPRQRGGERATPGQTHGRSQPTITLDAREPLRSGAEQAPDISLAPAWRRAISRRLLVSDVVAVLAVTFGVQVVWLGPQWSYQVDNGTRSLIAGPTYTMLSALIACGWLISLGISGSRSTRVLGEGLEEYRRVLTSSLWLFGLLAVLAYSMQYSVARGYVAISFPVGVAALCAERGLWRRWLNRQREDQNMVSRVLVVGTEAGTEPLALRIARSPSSGLQVVGTFDAHGGGERDSDTDAVVVRAADTRANAVVVTASAQMEPSRLRTLRWSLEELGAELIIAPALTGLSGERVHTRPVEGLSLLHVEGASYGGSMRLVKGVFDRAFAATMLALLSPLFLVVSALVRASSPGPAFYRQERIGRDGDTFWIWKFRTMGLGADDLLHHLLEAQGSDGTPLFKPSDDPRVTRVGRVLRKWSIDELPQLVNVLAGDMSLVGPRPQRAEEVALYDDAAVRRLRVKPGLTGLWQVSGRSDLSWERAVELDLYYVENWSFSFDLLLIWRTFAAVARSEGAY